MLRLLLLVEMPLFAQEPLLVRLFLLQAGNSEVHDLRLAGSIVSAADLRERLFAGCLLFATTAAVHGHFTALPELLLVDVIALDSS